MGLGDLFKRFTKGSPEGDQAAAAAKRGKGGKEMPYIPTFLKKDRFIREGTAEESVAANTAPEASEMAEEGSFKRPGKWLKAKLGGTTDTQAINNIEKTKVALKKSGAFNDQEIQSFLDGLLDPSPEETPSGQSSEAPKKA